MGGPLGVISQKPSTQPQVRDGGIIEVIVTDDKAQQSLENVLNELKKMNMHLMVMSDNEIDESGI